MGTSFEYECTYIIISLWILLSMINFSDKSCGENKNTHFIFIHFFVFENHAVCEICGKILQRRRDQGWKYTKAHALCMLGNSGYKCTFGLCNTYCFSKATAVTRRRFHDTFISTLPLFFTCAFKDELSIQVKQLATSFWHWVTFFFENFRFFLTL